MVHRIAGSLAVLIMLTAGGAFSETHLRPISWQSADFGTPDGSGAGRFDDLCRLIFFLGATGTANVACPRVTVQGSRQGVLDSSMDPNQHFSWESGGLRIDVDLVSFIEGNRWLMGYRNLQVSTGLVPQVGEPVMLGKTIGWLRLDLQVTARARFQVPQMGKEVLDVAFSVGDGVLSPDQIGLRSRRLGSFLSSGIPPVGRFLRGDEIALFAAYEFPDMLMRLIIQANSDQTGFIVSRTTTVEGPCGLRASLDDCVVAIGLSTPAPPPFRIQIR